MAGAPWSSFQRFASKVALEALRWSQFSCSRLPALIKQAYLKLSKCLDLQKPSGSLTLEAKRACWLLKSMLQAGTPLLLATMALPIVITWARSSRI